MRLVVMVVTVVVGFAVAAEAGTVHPVSYDMQNGGTGALRYWDDTYSGSGAGDYAPLTGGLGDLTDGVIATQNWGYVEGWYPVEGPYVGWHGRDQKIVFQFSGPTRIDTVTVHADDSNGWGSVYLPESVTIEMGGLSRAFPVSDPSGSDPLALVFGGLGLTGTSLELTWGNRPGPSTLPTWIMVSEVDFQGTAAATVPLPSAAWIGLGLLASLGAVRRTRGARKRRS